MRRKQVHDDDVQLLFLFNYTGINVINSGIQSGYTGEITDDENMQAEKILVVGWMFLVISIQLKINFKYVFHEALIKPSHSNLIAFQGAVKKTGNSNNE